MTFSSVKSIKKQFPIFNHHKNLVYLDSAATSQKPKVVIERITKFYEQENANIHRGIYDLSENATQMYEQVREKVAKFINAEYASEIVFTKGATEGINMVASSINFDKNDEIVVTEMEHHSVLVPFQALVKSKTQLKTKNLQILPITEDGQLDIKKLPERINKKTKIVALTYISNVLGTINPVKEIVKVIKTINPNTLILVDAAQAVPHMPVSVQDLGADFVVFSGHKMMGPTGVGVLWGKRQILEKLEPYQFGGSMISKVTQEKSQWAEVPQKFEAGTQNIAGVIGLGAAVDYLDGIGMEQICHREEELTAYALQQLLRIPKITIYGPQEVDRCGCDKKACGACVKNQQVCKNRLGIISFTLGGVHAHDVAQVLNQEGVAVRAGHHCAQPLHKKLGVAATVRMSLYVYNDREDVDRLVDGLGKVREVFGK